MARQVTSHKRSRPETEADYEQNAHEHPAKPRKQRVLTGPSNAKDHAEETVCGQLLSPELSVAVDESILHPHQPVPYWEALPKDILGIIVKKALQSGDAGRMRLTCRAWRQSAPFVEVEEIRCNLRQHLLQPLPTSCPGSTKRLVLSFASSSPEVQQFQATDVAELATCLSNVGLHRLSHPEVAASSSRCFVLQLPGFVASAKDIATALAAVPLLQQQWPLLQLHAQELRLIGFTGLETWLHQAHNVVDIVLRTQLNSLKHLHLKQGWPTYLLPRSIQDFPGLSSLSLELTQSFGDAWEQELPGVTTPGSACRSPYRSTAASSGRQNGRGGVLSFLQHLNGKITELEVRIPGLRLTSSQRFEDAILMAMERLLLPCTHACPSITKLVCLVQQGCCWRPGIEAEMQSYSLGAALMAQWKVSVALVAGNHLQQIFQGSDFRSVRIEMAGVKCVDVQIAFDAAIDV